MTKYLFLIFFIISNIYANEYQLEYNADFASCDGLEKVVNQNDHRYVTDVKTSPDSNIIYKRVLFAYHSAHSFSSVKDITSLEYYALLLKFTIEKKSGDSGGNVDVYKIDWEHSLLSRINLSSNINEDMKSYHHVSICKRNFINKYSNYIRDVLIINSWLNKPDYRMDSFIAIVHTKSSSTSPIEDASSMQTRDILTIHSSPDEVTKMWYNTIENNRKIYIKNNYIAQKITFRSNQENYIIQIFNSEQYTYTPEMLEEGISKRDLFTNEYIVKKMSNRKEFYMCALNLNKDESFLARYDSNLACFIVRLNTNSEQINSLNDVTFIETNFNLYSYTADERARISIGRKIFKVNNLGNNMIELIGSNFKFDLRLVYFLKLGYNHQISNADNYISVHNDFPELEYNLNKDQKKLKEDELIKDQKKLKDEEETSF